MRYVIKNAEGRYFSGCNVPETTYTPMPANPTVAVPRSMLAPQFDTVILFGAVKYETAADARDMLTHADLLDPAAFAGCDVLEVEFDSKQPEATRPAP